MKSIDCSRCPGRANGSQHAHSWNMPRTWSRGIRFHARLLCRPWLLSLVAAAFAAYPLVQPTTARAQDPAGLLRTASKESTVRVDHSAWTSLLKTYVRSGSDGLNRVNYAAFKQQAHSRLKQYIRAVEGTELPRLHRNEQFALLANLYNAKTIDIVLDRYPVASIKEINLGGGLFGAIGGGPWKAKVLTIEGVSLSLDDIEHAMLRPSFRDPRVHYAVNCASIGCPNLQTVAFTGVDLHSQLNVAAREFINHPRGLNVSSGQLIASSIYQWFSADFGGSAEGVLAHLRRFGRPQLMERLKHATKIDGYQYDWSLNDARN